MKRGFGVADPTSPKRRVYDDPEVEALREKLREHNGIRGLEICEPHETKKIARIFHRDGFVVVKDLLNAEQLARWRAGMRRSTARHPLYTGTGETENIQPKQDGSHTAIATVPLPLQDRCCTIPAWASMIDLPTTTPIVTEIFGSSDYRVWGSGGDLCLPGAVEYQHLHSRWQGPTAPFRSTHSASRISLGMPNSSGTTTETLMSPHKR